MILFASLSARISGDEHKFNSETLKKLNQVMMLSARDDALDLPVQFCKVIWNKDHQDVVLYPTQALSKQLSIDAAVDKIISSIPEWLKYSNMKGLREDLSRLIQHQEVIVS